MVVSEGAKRGITSFAMIHDDFGVHACHIDEWHEIIRDQFVKLHSHNVLAEFKLQQEERAGIALPDLPETGSLDLEGVRSSRYFFG
jgi:DNA-directed RNA polymerase